MKTSLLTLTGPWAPWFHVADRMNLDYNLLPSLHVAFSVCCAAIDAHQAARAVTALLWSWAAAIALSTLLTHQHQLIDVATGGALGLLAERRKFRPCLMFPDKQLTSYFSVFRLGGT